MEIVLRLLRYLFWTFPPKKNCSAHAQVKHTSSLHSRAHMNPLPFLQVSQVSRMESTENSLSFFTSNHSKHDSQWRMTGRNVTLVCVACLVELLESPNVLHLRKRKALQEIVFLLTNNQNVLELFCQSTQIVSHLCSTIMDLLSSENELLMNTAVEALDIITVKLRSEKLVEKVMETLENQILRLNNFRKSLKNQ